MDKLTLARVLHDSLAATCSCLPSYISAKSWINICNMDSMLPVILHVKETTIMRCSLIKQPTENSKPFATIQGIFQEKDGTF